MRSDIIEIYSSGQGFEEAQRETEHFATAGMNLTHAQALHLCLITEEMLSLINSVAGEVNAKFWLEDEGPKCILRLTTHQRLGNTQRNDLIESTTSGKNDAAKGFLGKLREMFETAMSVSADQERFFGSEEYHAAEDISDRVISTPKWDKYERSVLLTLADNVRISIRSSLVELTVEKTF